MSRALIRSLVVLSVIAIVGILTVQAVWLRRAYALGERQFRQTAFVALQEVAEQVARLNRIRQTQATITQLSPDYYVVRTDAPIDPVLLEHYLQTALRRHRLLTDFEYGIYNCETEQMVYGGYVEPATQATAKGKLPKRRRKPRFPGYTHYFEIRFPGQAGFVTGQLNGWLASSVAVALVVVLFGYTLWVVLRQRRLADVQREFINNVTHELQTPVSTLRIAAGVLQQPGLIEQPDRLKQYARVVAEESSRLQRQVQAVLNLARRQQTGFANDRLVVDLNQILTDVATNHPDIIRLNLETAPAWLLADPYALETLLNNLVDNARTYCKDIPCIVLTTQRVGRRLVWSVADNGIGIAKGHQRAVFRQFYRVPNGDVPTGKGFGLGLYYVWRVARAHGWKLRLDSVPGQGSTFTFTAPLASQPIQSATTAAVW